MSLWIIIPLVIWLVGFLTFIGAVVREAPKHASRVNGLHIFVGAIWPFWGMWYLWVIITEKFRGGLTR